MANSWDYPTYLSLFAAGVLLSEIVRRDREWLTVFTRTVVLIGVVVDIYEVFAPLSFSKVIGRSAGLYENPNMAGEALVLESRPRPDQLRRYYRIREVLSASP